MQNKTSPLPLPPPAVANHCSEGGFCKSRSGVGGSPHVTPRERKISVSLCKDPQMRRVELIYVSGHGTPLLLVSPRPCLFAEIFPVAPAPVFQSHLTPTRSSYSNGFNTYLVVCTCTTTHVLFYLSVSLIDINEGVLWNSFCILPFHRV